MNYVGKINDIAKPEVTANGVPVVSVSVNNQVGEIATCSCLMRPEDVSRFMAPDTIVTVKIDGDSGGGTIFTGYVSGVNMTHMSGNLSAGVDLTHVKGRDLNDASVTVPGVIPGGNVDVKTILFREAAALADSDATSYFEFNLTEGSFGSQVTNGLADWMSSNKVSTTINFDPSDEGEKEKAIAALGSIEDLCGELNVPSELNLQINKFLHGVLARGGASSSVWDMLSVILGAFDAVLVCKPDGELAICPNFSGIKSQGNTVPAEIIQKFDRSAQMTRSPRECLIVGNTSFSGLYNELEPNAIGKYTSDMPGLRGTLLLSVPGWANDMAAFVATEFAAKAMDSLAEANILRYAHKEKTFNLVTPPCPDVVPGTSASFQPTSGLKNFDGGKVSVFEQKFDGYCYKIQHLLEYNNFCTVFWFATALESSYSKPASHPLFPGGSMLPWS
jgi:hypothetical protein